MHMCVCDVCVNMVYACLVCVAWYACGYCVCMCIHYTCASKDQEDVRYSFEEKSLSEP